MPNKEKYIINGYDLSRSWFDYCFINPEKVKPNHTALYFFCIEHCNRLGWKNKFGLPTTMAREAIGIRSYNTYKNTLDDLVDWGFIIMIEKSKNQYSSNIIALSKFDKTLDNALDKAFIKHGSKQSESTDQSIGSIIKQINNKQVNKEQVNKLKSACDLFLNESKDLFLNDIYPFEEFWDDYDKKVDRIKCEVKFKRLTNTEKELIKEFIPKYKKSQPDRQFRKDPSTFLNNKSWNNEIIKSEPVKKLTTLTTIASNHDKF